MSRLWVVLPLALVLTACDPGWVRQSYIAPSKSAFPACVDTAVAKISGISVDPAFSRPNLVFVRARNRINITVEKLKDGTLQVNAGTIGMEPSDEQLAYVVPLLGALTTQLAKEC